MQRSLVVVSLLAVSIGLAIGCSQPGPLQVASYSGGSGNKGGESSVGGNSIGSTSSSSNDSNGNGGTSSTSTTGSSDRGNSGSEQESGGTSSSSSHANGGTRNSSSNSGNAEGGSNDGDGGTSNAEGGSNDGDGGTSNAEGGSNDGDGGTSNAEGGSNDGDGGTSNAEGGSSDGDGGTSSAEGGSSDGDGGTSSSSSGIDSNGGSATTSNSNGSGFTCAKGMPSGPDIAPGTNGTWGSASSLAGGTFLYQDVDASKFTVDTTTTAGSVILTATIAANGYAGYGLFFKDPEKCWDASSYTGGIRMTLGGNLGGAKLIFQVQTNSNYPVDSSNKKGACSGTWSSGCALNQSAIGTVPSTASAVEVPWSSLTGGQPNTLQTGELLGIQWQVNCPTDAKANCTPNLTIGKVEFY